MSSSRRPTAATVVAALAICAALGGSALASADLAKRPVRPSEVKRIVQREAVRAVDRQERELVPAGSVVVAGNQTSARIDNFTTKAYTTVLRTQLRAADTGTALITATVGAADDATLPGAGLLGTRIAVDADPQTTDPYNSPSHIFFGADRGGTATNTVRVPVTDGIHNVHLQIREDGTGSFVFTRQLNVLFVPR